MRSVGVASRPKRQSASRGAVYASGVFNCIRRVELEDGRTLVVQYQGENYGWGAYVPGTAPAVAQADTPAAAISAYLGYSESDAPAWVTELSEGFERDLRDAPRYPCPCCGHKTLLNTGSHEICDVCRWEDEPRTSEDQHSGANGSSLRQARANFAAFEAATRAKEPRARRPRPSE